MQIHAITWNLFHGRDKPPDPRLFTWRGRLLRRTERNETHQQVNRDLTREFTGLIAAAEWDVALLQEAPPRFCEPLASACDAETHRALTSRNSLAPARRFLARINPDLIASGEGGSNLTLVRHGGSLGTITERRELVIRARAPERRVMAFTRTSSGICVANLHTSNDRPDLAAPGLGRAADAAIAWAGDAPIIFGGDFNLRPGENRRPFTDLGERGFARPTGPRSIDHLLTRGLKIAETPRPWPPEAREVREDGLAIRLSDHAPVEAVFDRA
jgi:endonuclease/exonuclease/phosphatase family metal-dependent hydrolase